MNSINKVNKNKQPPAPPDVTRAAEMDLRDPRAKGSWPCRSNHVAGSWQKNSHGLWQHCQVCNLRLAYVPRLGAPSSSTQSMNYNMVNRMLTELEPMMKGRTNCANMQSHDGQGDSGCHGGKVGDCSSPCEARRSDDQHSKGQILSDSSRRLLSNVESQQLGDGHGEARHGDPAHRRGEAATWCTPSRSKDGSSDSCGCDMATAFEGEMVDGADQ